MLSWWRIKAVKRIGFHFAIGLALAGSACQGDLSSQPPIHLNPNMDNVARFDPQEPNPMFADGRAMRPQVPGTVARDQLKEDTQFFFGKNGEDFVTEMPVEMDETLIRRGQERYNIYCAVCHDRAGVGQGIAVQRGMLPPPDLHSERIRSLPVGQIYDAVANGVRNMPAYGPQIPVRDRWAIVSYVRALQLSQHAGFEQVPEDISVQKGWKAP